ncbi:MAG: DUF192 domain-containing protein [Deltaproteobacteria bacterium]
MIIKMKVINKTKNTIICESCGWADTLYTRAKGLLGRKSIADDEGLVITGCRSIHSFFMKFPICAIFIDKNNKVVKVLENFKVNRLSGYYIKADKVIELPPWKAKNTFTSIGDIIEFNK